MLCVGRGGDAGESWIVNNRVDVGLDMPAVSGWRRGGLLRLMEGWVELKDVKGVSKTETHGELVWVLTCWTTLPVLEAVGSG